MSLISKLTEEFQAINGILKKLTAKTNTLGVFEAVVAEVSEPGSDEEDFFGVGAVRIQSLQMTGLNSWARPKTICTPIPPKGSIVVVESGTRLGDLVYGYYSFDTRDTLFTAPHKTDFGFVDSTPPYEYGGKRLKALHENRGLHQIIASAVKWIIGVRADDEDGNTGELDNSVADGWKISNYIGSGGEFNVKYQNPSTDLTTGGSITVNIHTGDAGEINLASTTSGTVNIKGGTSGKVEIKTGSATTEKMVLGETLEEKLDALLDEIIKMNQELQILKVPTAVGMSGVPDNAGKFSTIETAVDGIKQDLGEILSLYNKNN